MMDYYSLKKILLSYKTFLNSLLYLYAQKFQKSPRNTRKNTKKYFRDISWFSWGI